MNFDKYTRKWQINLNDQCDDICFHNSHKSFCFSFAYEIVDSKFLLVFVKSIIEKMKKKTKTNITYIKKKIWRIGTYFGKQLVIQKGNLFVSLKKITRKQLHALQKQFICIVKCHLSDISNTPIKKTSKCWFSQRHLSIYLFTILSFNIIGWI